MSKYHFKNIVDWTFLFIRIIFNNLNRFNKEIILLSKGLADLNPLDYKPNPNASKLKNQLKKEKEEF